MVHEVLRNQAEEKLQNERRYVTIPRSGAHSNEISTGIQARFPINSLNDFVRLNDDLRDQNYASRVVSETNFYALVLK